MEITWKEDKENNTLEGWIESVMYFDAEKTETGATLYQLRKPLGENSLDFPSIEAAKEYCEKTLLPDVIKNINNFNVQGETILAKLKNQLTPAYGLADAVILGSAKEGLQDIIMQMAKQAIDNKPVIKDLLNRMDEMYIKAEETEKENLMLKKIIEEDANLIKLFKNKKSNGLT
jgi:hypothetical protein